jgi:glycosyltransferase involved in cell wall biosynthesis
MLTFYRLIEKIFPINTKRRMLVKLFLYSVTNTKGVLKGLNKNNLRKFLKVYGIVAPSVIEGEIIRTLSEKNIWPSKVVDPFSYYTTPAGDELFANVKILKPPVEKNRILVVDRFLPEHDKDSGSLRAFSIINILTKLGYRVTFLPDDLIHREPYASDLIRMGVAVLNRPLHVEKYLEKKGPEFSYVILSRPEQAYKYISLMRAHAINSKIIYDTVDLHWVRYERGYKTTGQDEFLRQANLFKPMELLCASCSDMVITVTPEEKEILLRENSRLKVEIIPNVHNISSRDIRPFHQRKDLMFIGSYKHTPNEDAVLYFADEIFPLVKKALPGVRFLVVGSDPTAALLKRNSKDVIVTGYVKDVKPYFEECRVFVTPLRYGAGMKGKIGQSMAYGLPVVTTGIGAEGIGLEDGTSALIADDPKSFAEAIIRLYTDEGLWKRYSEKAFEVVQSNYTDEAIGKRIANILNSLKGEGL